MPENQDFYKDLLDNLFDGVYFVDRDRVITYWNKGAERITGYSAERVIGHSCKDNLLNHVSTSGVPLCLTACPLAACMKDGQNREAEVYLHHADGYRLPVMVRVSVLRDEHGEIIGAVETFSDNSRMLDAHRQLRELKRSSHTDLLTGLGNRKHCESRLRAVLANFEASGESAGILFLDVDHFKKINDTFGHAVGDQVLRVVASTLRHNLRATDSVCRWGGEEFVVLLDDVPSMEVLKALAEKCRMLVEQSRVDSAVGALMVTISIGATLMQAADTLEKVIHRADRLMYASKQSGRNCVTSG